MASSTKITADGSRFSAVFVIDGFGRKRFQAASLAKLSAMWCDFRDASGFGNSEIRSGGVVMHCPEDKRAAAGEAGYLSYNGKVWRNSEAWKTEPPLFDPYAQNAGS